MLEEIIAKKRYSFHEKFEGWEDAVRAACLPLFNEKAIEECYIDQIIKNIKEFGPYIVIAPNVCIPHAQEGQGVNETAVCFMACKEPVHFSESPEHDARLFFVLASTNNDLHMENLMNMVALLEDEVAVEGLLCAKCEEDLVKVLQK
ncbi:MAG: PTS sugar transporter subunit IIA [Cellulosilyticaceae bacterium]